MEKTITKVFVKETYNTQAQNSMPTPMMGSQVNFEFGPGGTIPGILVEYADGDKLLMLQPDASIFSWRNQTVHFRTEDYAWNDKVKRWDRTETQAFGSSGVIVDNNHLVHSVNGQDRSTFYKMVDDTTRPILDADGVATGMYNKKEELIDPTKNPTFIGEFTFWFNNLGKTALIPPLQDTMQEYFLRKFPNVEPEVAP